jgi:hypothetical protein
MTQEQDQQVYAGLQRYRNEDGEGYTKQGLLWAGQTIKRMANKPDYLPFSKTGNPSFNNRPPSNSGLDYDVDASTWK